MTKTARDAFMNEVALALAPGALEPVEFNPAIAARLEERLEAHFGTPALLDVVEELCLFACWIGSARKSPTARNALLAIARKALPSLEAMSAPARQLANAVAEAADGRDYSRFTGATTPRLEPKKPPGNGEVPAGPFARTRLARAHDDDDNKS